MERNRMETEFSRKLNQREIKPSEAAWDRLDAMLSAAESQPKTVKKSYKWLYIAASFLGFLLVGTLFFRQTEGKEAVTENGNVQIVESAKTESAEPGAIQNQPESQIAEVSTESEEKPISKPKATLKTVFAQKAHFADNSIANSERKSSESNHQTIDQKTDRPNQPSLENTGATAEELLAAAQAKRESGTAGPKVSAKSLLLQVDSQAEEKLTLKQRAIRALNKNYQHVKIAVENRNLEESH